MISLQNLCMAFLVGIFVGFLMRVKTESKHGNFIATLLVSIILILGEIVIFFPAVILYWYLVIGKKNKILKHLIEYNAKTCEKDSKNEKKYKKRKKALDHLNSHWILFSIYIFAEIILSLDTITCGLIEISALFVNEIDKKYPSSTELASILMKYLKNFYKTIFYNKFNKRIRYGEV